MYNFNMNETPIIFNSLIKKPIHKYPTKFSKDSFSLKRSSSMVRNIVFLSEDAKFEMIF